MMENNENAKQIRKLMLKMMRCYQKNKNDENVKHGRLGGLFANKITYITVKIPTSIRMLVMI